MAALTAASVSTLAAALALLIPLARLFIAALLVALLACATLAALTGLLLPALLLATLLVTVALAGLLATLTALRALTFISTLIACHGFFSKLRHVSKTMIASGLFRLVAESEGFALSKPSACPYHPAER